ncbi:hypothetical protein F5Y16DRAFT_187709 [Xylariaceae sp. FL0255]|nr:hypothetical protein F5Y16DRAFT_187709 [Xylariaceae sp. FL0255]
MDIFDTSAYFSRAIPLKASRDQLLKYSVCALSAKHLHRTQRCSESSRPSRTHVMGVSGSTNWDYLSALFYDNATTSLKSAVESLNSQKDATSILEPPEETLAAITILCQYGAYGRTWSILGSSSKCCARSLCPIQPPLTLTPHFALCLIMLYQAQYSRVLLGRTFSVLQSKKPRLA